MIEHPTEESAKRPGPGRPRATSVATLTEAALELFFEHGFDNTNIEQITQRAGVSRGTFFSYFDQKADCLWVDLGSAIDAVQPGGGEAVAACAAALVDAVRPWGTTVPVALRDAKALGAVDALALTAPTRLLPLIERLALRIALAEDALPEQQRPRAVAGALVGASVGAIVAWVDAASHDSVDVAVADALAPLVLAYRSAT